MRLGKNNAKYLFMIISFVIGLTQVLISSMNLRILFVASVPLLAYSALGLRQQQDKYLFYKGLVFQFLGILLSSVLKSI